MRSTPTGKTIGRDAVVCRQLAHRARAHIRAARRRFAVSSESGHAIARAFFAASRSGDLDGLRALLAEEVTAIADGGGKTGSTPAPLVGLAAVMALHERLTGLFAQEPSQLLQFAMIGGLPGFVSCEPGGVLQTTALAIDGDRIMAIYVMQNPDKLGRVRAAIGA